MKRLLIALVVLASVAVQAKDRRWQFGVWRESVDQTGASIVMPIAGMWVGLHQVFHVFVLDGADGIQYQVGTEQDLPVVIHEAAIFAIDGKTCIVKGLGEKPEHEYKLRIVKRTRVAGSPTPNKIPDRIDASTVKR
jgi:hypothetical protein